MWSSWSLCTQTCDVGLRTRSRICVNGEFGDPGCSEELDESETCNEQVKRMFFAGLFICEQGMVEDVPVSRVKYVNKQTPDLLTSSYNTKFVNFCWSDMLNQEGFPLTAFLE